MTTTSTSEEFTFLPVAALRESPLNPRKQFDPGQLAELTESVKAKGVLMPLLVRKAYRSPCLNHMPGDPTHEIIAGARRYRAAKAADLEQVPVRITDLDDGAALEVMVIENLHRADVHPMEEAEGYQALLERGHPVDELHAKVGKSRSYVYGRLKLLALEKPARDAFYAGEISASIALLLARIPNAGLQKEALADITESSFGDMSYREAREHIQQNYMLALKSAPFPVSDPALVKNTPACGACPKRTGNQPELFGDVASADVCTDPACFDAKTRAQGIRTLDEARAQGHQVIDDARQIKKIAPHGVHRSLTGYLRVDEKEYRDYKSRTVGKIVGPDVPRTLLQDPDTGKVVAIVPAAAVDKALRASGQNAGRDDGAAAERKKAKTEQAFRQALYEAVKPKLLERASSPTFADLARRIFDDLHHHELQALCRLRGFEPPKTKATYGSPQINYRAAGAGIEDMTQDDLVSFLLDMLYLPELIVSGWSTAKPERLLAAATVHEIDIKAIRKSVTQAKPKAKAKAKKKAAPKRKRAGSES